jgi:DNA invertase Pin-like site-specific DNA recombinase
VFTADGGEVLADDPSDPMRTAMRQMAGVFAQLDRALVVKRMKDGREAKRAKGDYAGGGPALGYRAEDRELVPVESEQATIARVKELHGAGSSLREICATLTTEGRRTKRGTTNWHPNTVARMVSRLDATAGK